MSVTREGRGERGGLADALLAEQLAWRARREPARTAYTFLDAGGNEEARFDWNELHRRACGIAARLDAEGMRGERVVLAHPAGLEFLAAFFGCLLSGAVAVPCPLPGHRRTRPRFLGVLADCRPAAILGAGEHAQSWSEIAADSGTMRAMLWIASDEPAAPAVPHLPAPDPGAPAFLQYTSGSTSEPRGVIVTHAHLTGNQRMIAAAFGQGPESRILSWLPLHHDMGLIGVALHTLHVGATCFLMPPAAFLRRPLMWLDAISRLGATTSGAPNFAYDLCVRSATDPGLARLDLRAWTVAFNGSEPVRAATLERFAATFAPCGFRSAALRPCYGLAEATLLVSAADGPRSCRLDRTALERGQVRAAGSGDRLALDCVSCGPPAPGVRVAVVEPASGRSAEPGRIGEIWIAGPAVAAGYWGREPENPHTFAAKLADEAGPRFLRSGDLGFLQDGELYVTGRIKDLIIVRGRNLYPQDIERTAGECHPAIRPEGVAAFVWPEAESEERLAICAEVDHRASAPDWNGVARAVRRAVAEAHEVRAARVIFVRSGALPRTSSGKLRRRACAQALAAGGMDPLAICLDAPEAAPSPRAPIRASLLALPRAARAQRLLAELCAEVARAARVSEAAVHPSLSAVAHGLDSLAAVELRNALEVVLAIPIETPELLRDVPLEALALELAERLEHAGRVAAETREVAPGDATRLSSGEHALWLAERLAPGDAAYHLAFAFRLPAAADVDALTRALDRLVERHESLRTVFPARDGEPSRAVEPARGLAVGRAGVSAPASAALAETLAAEARQRFDLEREWPIRVHLHREAAGTHVVLLVVHHIAVDFWSLEILLGELGALYAAECEGAPVEWAPPAGREDAVAWQRSRAEGEPGERLWRRWRERLAGELPRTGLEPDRAGGAERGESLPFHMGRAHWEGVVALARSRGATPYAVLLAAFAAFLHQQSGQDDILVGSPVARRGRAGLESRVGYLANLVPLRLDLSGDPSFASLVERARAVVAEALDLADLPFAEIVARLGLAHEPGRHPLVDVVLALEQPRRLAGADAAALVLGDESARVRLGALELQPVRFAAPVPPFDLTLLAVAGDDGLRGAFQYRADRFEPATAARWREGFERLLGAALAGPEASLSRLVAPDEDQARALRSWSGLEAAARPEACVHEVFRDAAARRPEAVALRAGDRSMTYGELERRSIRLAARLRSAGVGAESRVGLLLETSIELVVAMLATLQAGGAYVPLDPADPPERHRFLMEDAGIRAVVADPAWPTPVPGIALVGPDDDPDAPPCAIVAAANHPARLACVMYTSGSSGRPKGVMVTHRAIVNLVRENSCAELGPEQVHLFFAPPGFDAATFEIWGALLNGARLVVFGGDRRSLPALGEVIAREGVTTLWLTAGLFHLVVEERLGDLGPLRQLLAGGDVLSPPHVRRALDRHPGLRLINGYGPTETTTFACCHVMTASADVPDRVPIGRPVRGAALHVLDTALRAVPAGVPGELFIGGLGLARGYLGRPGLTALRYLPDPFGPPGARLYRTGDRARWRADGTLEFLGRHDDQVKVRGFRVEPGEIEARLAEHPAVAAAAVVAPGDAHGDRRLVAFVTPRSQGSRPEAGSLRAHLGARLPAAFVPGEIVVLERMPLTPNGKVDRRRLSALAPAGTAGSAAAAPPAGSTEALVASVWNEVLEAETLDPERNLFELGAHSLAVARAHARLCDRLGRAIPIVELFAHPTIRAFALHLDGGGASGIAAGATDRAAARRASHALRRARAAAGSRPAPKET